DVFRDEKVRWALASLDPSLSLTIVATSRSNEIPDNLRLPFSLKFVNLSVPSIAEKQRVLQKLKVDELLLDAARQERLKNANSWLVMMMEASAGRELTKIVWDSVHRLKQQDEVMYRAYEYLCYAGQYDIPIPASLIAAL